MTDNMWLTCCQCGQRFEIFGELAVRSRAFYDAQPNHTTDKEVGVCDTCWERRTRPPVERRTLRRWPQFRLSTILVLLAIAAWAMSCWPWIGAEGRWLTHEEYLALMKQMTPEEESRRIDSIASVDQTGNHGEVHHWLRPTSAVNPMLAGPALALAAFAAWKSVQFVMRRRRGSESMRLVDALRQHAS